MLTIAAVVVPEFIWSMLWYVGLVWLIGAALGLLSLLALAVLSVIELPRKRLR